jgi:hypothetical protein
MFEWIATKVISGAAGTLLQGLGKIGLDFYKTKLTAENTTEQHTVDLARKAMDLDQREAELNNRLLIAEQGNWATRWVRPVWAFPFVFWTYKVIIWDLCFGWGTTHDLKGTPGTLCILVAGAYFGERGINKVMDRMYQWRSVATGKPGLKPSDIG